MPEESRGPLLPGGYRGQILTKREDGSTQTVWTDPSSLGLGGGGGGGREVLAEDRIYFVATTGDDANDGLTAETAFLTINHAVAVVSALDLGNCICTVKVADGTYPEYISTLPIIGGRYEGNHVPPARIVGNTVAPQNVVIGNGTTTISTQGSGWRVEGFKTILTAGQGIYVYNSSLSLGRCIIENGIGTPVQPIFVTSGGKLIISAGLQGMMITGARFFSAIQIRGQSYVENNSTINIGGNPQWDAACLDVSEGSYIFLGGGFAGTATAQKYRVKTNGVINNQGRGPDNLPGDGAGLAETGGQYV